MFKEVFDAGGNYLGVTDYITQEYSGRILFMGETEIDIKYIYTDENTISFYYKGIRYYSHYKKLLI